jgi:hypothetical protein
VRTLVVAALLLVLPSGAARAQVFLASEPHPEFAVGPLFVVANVRPDLGEVIINLSLSLTARPGRRAADIRQPLYLLWPAEVTASTAAGPADPALAAELEAHGFSVVSAGRLALRGRDRMQLGTSALGDLVDPPASYANFIRRGQTAGQVGAGAYVKIPWTPRLADPLSIITLTFPLRGLVTPKPATWVEELFWGRRYILSVAFGDLGSLALPVYPLYFVHRNRVVPLAREFSLIIANFADSDHLKIEEIAPAAASRRPSRVRAGAEIVALGIAPSEGITPQALKVQFSYFAGRVNWRPVVVSGLLLLVSNFAGVVFLSRDTIRTLLKRRRARRRQVRRAHHEPSKGAPE